MKTCGLDVHKDMIFCAIYDGKDAVVNKYDTFTPDLEVMCDFRQPLKIASKRLNARSANNTIQA